MGAVPKHKTSTRRKGKRRSSINLETVNTTTCTNCGQQKLPHQACKSCGHYHTA